MPIDRETGEILPEATARTTPTRPDFLATLGQLQGGTLPDLLTRALADTAMAVAEQSDGTTKGKIALEFTIARGKGPFTLVLEHKIKYAHPTARGKKMEEAGDRSDVFLNTLGHVSVIPDGQGKLF